MTRSAVRPIAFWLAPAPRDRARLVQMIDALAREFDAPPFDPHVTVHVGEQAFADDIAAIVAGATCAASPIDLTVTRTSHTPALFKTLFVEFEPDERLHALGAQLRSALQRPSEYELHPHLSLLYRELPEDRRIEIAGRCDLRGERIRFDRLVVVRPGGTDDHWRDIRAWDAWREAPLGGIPLSA